MTYPIEKIRADFPILNEKSAINRSFIWTTPRVVKNRKP